MPSLSAMRRRLNWHFHSRKGHAGFLTWSWEAQDPSGRVVLESKESFAMLTNCLQHAADHGYVEKALPRD
jgi:hypothetical protein